MSKKKKELRKEMKVVLSSLDERWLKAASAEVAAQLQRLLDTQLHRRVRHILAWTSFFPGEVDLSQFIFEQVDKYEVYLPRCLEDRSMTFISIGHEWLHESEAGPSGMPQPKDSAGSYYQPSNAAETLVLVPGMAFDREGNRLGRGQGYYDRFLGQAAMKRCMTVGVGWSLQLVDSVPSETHDVGLAWICNEHGFERTGFATSEEVEEL